MKTITRLIYAGFAAVALAIGIAGANGAPGDLFVSINSTGENGAGSISQYKPTGQFRIFASGLSEPRGLAFDRSGNLFVANTTFDGIDTFQASIVEITPDGTQSTFATLSGNFIGEGVAFDRAGNLFVAAIDETNPNAYGPSIIYEITPAGVQSTFGTLPHRGFGLAFDSASNLFAADAGDTTTYGTARIFKFTPAGTRTVFANQAAFGSLRGPVGLAFDRLGNLYVSVDAVTPNGTDVILKFAPNGVRSTFATGLDWPVGLAFDRSGNLFVANRGVFAPPAAIYEFTPGGVRTTFAPDVDDPRFFAFQLR